MGAAAWPHPAFADSFEAQLCDYTYTFASPGDTVGCQAGLRLGAIVNFGGEVGGDRTASELPTPSGRYRLDTGETLEFFATPAVGFSALYEVANFSLGLATRL